MVTNVEILQRKPRPSARRRVFCWRDLVGVAALLATAAASGASTVVDFSGDLVGDEWSPDSTVWRSVQGAWAVTIDDTGTQVLRSRAIGEEEALLSSYCFLDFQKMGGTKFSVVFRVVELGSVARASVPVFYASFSSDAPSGQAPKSLVTVTGQPNPLPGGTNLSGDDFSFVLTGAQGEDGKSAVQTIAESVSTGSALITLKIEVDAAGQTARAAINEGPFSEPVPLEQPWDEARFLRLFQRGLVLEVIRVEAGY